jgi:spore germination protein
MARTRAARRRRATARRRLAAVGLILAVLVTLGLARLSCRDQQPPFTGRLGEPGGGRAYRVTAWSRGDPASISAALKAKAIDEVDFVWYLSQADGTVTAEREDLDLVQSTRRNGAQAFATVVNRKPGGGFDGAIAARILATPASRHAHLEALAKLVVDKGYDGLDLDWELVPVADRDRFSAFVEELASALHQEDRLLSIAVFPKESEPGAWVTQKAADYQRLGAAVDEFKVMTYSYSGGWSGPGPQTPLAWADRVLTFAASQVAPQKVLMGVPFYGFDWHGEAATALQWRDAAAKLKELGMTASRHAASQEATFHYEQDGVAHTVFFQDRTAIAAKLGLLTSKHATLAGIAVWQMYGEDPGFWTVIRRGLRMH